MPPQNQEDELARARAEAFRAQQATIKAMQEQQQRQAQAMGATKAGGAEIVKTIPEKNGIVYRYPDGKLVYTEMGPGGGVTYSSNDPVEIQRIIQGEAPGQARRTTQQEQIVAQEGGRAAALSAIRGIPFAGEYFDEMMGILSNDPRYAEAIRELQTAYAEQKPVEAFAGQAALGTVATLPLVPFQAAGRALQAAPTLLKGMLGMGAAGAGLGAVEGAVSGFGAGTGTVEERLPGAGMGAGFGAAFGGLLGAASEPLRFGIENVTKYFSNAPVRQLAKDLGISEDAAKMIRLFIKDGDIDSARAALSRAGSKSMLAEVSPGTKRLLDAAIELGSGSQAPLDAIELRVATSNEELDRGLNRFFGGPPLDVTDMQTDILRSTAEARQAAYDAAYASPINYNSIGGQNLLNQTQNLTPDIISEANRLMQTDPYLATKPPPLVLKKTPKQEAPPAGVRPAPAGGAAAPARKPARSVMGETDAFSARRRARDATAAETPATLGTSLFGRPVAGRTQITKTLDDAEFNRISQNIVNENPLNLAADLDETTFRRLYENATDQQLRQILKSPGGAKKFNLATPEDMKGASRERLLEMLYNRSLDAAEERGFIRFTTPEPSPAGVSSAPPPQASPPPAGGVQFETLPTVQQWDYIARALQDRAKREQREVGTSQMGRNYEGTLNNIRSELKTQIPAYKEALGIAADTFAEQEAMDLGSRMLQKSTTVGEIARFMKTAEKPEIEALKKGVRADIQDQIGSVRTSALNPNTDAKELSTALSLLRSPNNMEKMRAVLGQKEFDDFYKLIDEQATSIELMGAVARNSKTAGRQNIEKTAEQVMFGGGILSQMGRGKVINTQEVLVQSMTGLTPEADAARRMGLYDDIASVLTRVQGQEAKDALEMIERARRGRVLTDGQARIIAKAMTRPAAMAIYAPVTAGQREAQIQPRRGREATE